MGLTTNEILSSFDKEWTGYFGWGIVPSCWELGGSELISAVNILYDSRHIGEDSDD